MINLNPPATNINIHITNELSCKNSKIENATLKIVNSVIYSNLSATIKS